MFCLISSHVSCYVCHFPLVWLFFFLHVISAADTSYRSLFLFVMLLHISFHAYHFIQKNLSLCGPDNVDWIKRVLCPICLCLPKPFYQRTVFCCRSLSLALLSLILSCSSVFLVGLWALLFIGLSSVWAFGHGFKKWASTNCNSRVLGGEKRLQIRVFNHQSNLCKS